MEYDILLVNVTRTIYSSISCFSDCLGLYSIASYLDKKNFIAKVLSTYVYNCKEAIINEIENRGIKIIGFYTASDNLSVVKNLIKWIKKNYNVIIIVGGPESVALKEDFLRETKCDFISEGEGEETTYELLSFLIDGIGKVEDIKNLRYINKEDIFCENDIRKPIMNLDSIGFPNIKNSLNLNFRKSDTVGIITGRGCPYHCSFCYEGANAKCVRLRSLKNVFEEIDYIIENNKSLKYINIYDDTFTLNYDRVKEFCKEIKKRNIKWFCEAHATNICKYDDMIDIMIDAGLIGMQIGLESGSDRVLKAYNKNTNAEMICKVVEKCKKSNLTHMSGNFIVGGALESKETIKESMDLAAKLIEIGRGMFECTTVFLAPYPKTRISSCPEEFDLTIHKDLLKKNVNTMKTAVISTKKLSIEEITNAKIEFDKFINEQYKKQALLSEKKDIYNCFFGTGSYMNLNPKWSQAYYEQQYIETFIMNGFNTDESNIKEKYPIRSFEMLYYDKDFLICGEHKYNGLEKIFLENSSGIYNMQQIANLLNININKAIEIYRKLNNECVVYLSEF